MFAVLFAAFFTAMGHADGEDRSSELVNEGFNFTRSVTASDGAATSVDILIPPSDDPVRVVLSFEATGGEVAVKLVGSKDSVIAQWTGTRGDVDVTRTLATGRYRVDIVPDKAATAKGVVGVKGPVVGQCKLEAGRIVERPAGKGFAWPYLLARPKTASKTTTLLVAPNNTGFSTEDLELLRADASCEIRGALALADKLGTSVLVPLFPRPAQGASNLYLHALTRDALTATTPAHKRVDLQLIAMIDDARAALRKDGIAAGPRVLIAGFSASGSFANRFAVLHPERTLAAAVGSPGGWPLAPVVSDGKDALPYPVGVADVAKLSGVRIDRAALAKVSFLFFLGDADLNDAVVFRDSFSADDEALIMRKYGKTPVERWAAAQRLYEAAKLHADFKLYKGVAHQITPAMLSDIEATFRAALERR